jgi:hypothetical protein
MTIHSPGVPNDLFFQVVHLNTGNSQQIYPAYIPSAPNPLEVRINDTGPWVSSAGSCGMTVRTQQCYEITVWKTATGPFGNSRFSFKILDEKDINMVLNYDYATNTFSIINQGDIQYYYASINNPLFCWTFSDCPMIDLPATTSLINGVTYKEGYIITAANSIDLDNNEFDPNDRPQVVYDAGNLMGQGYILLLPSFHAYYDGCPTQIEIDLCKKGFFLAAIDGCGGITFNSSPPARISMHTPDNIEVSPNPVIDRLSLSELSKMGIIYEVKILNINGQSLYEQKINEKMSEMELGVSQLSQGIYILRVEAENGVQSKRFVKE